MTEQIDLSTWLTQRSSNCYNDTQQKYEGNDPFP